MTKIFVKINETKTQVPSDEDDEARISTAMRVIGLNIGNSAPNTRGLASVNHSEYLSIEIHRFVSLEKYRIKSNIPSGYKNVTISIDTVCIYWLTSRCFCSIKIIVEMLPSILRICFHPKMNSLDQHLIIRKMNRHPLNQKVGHYFVWQPFACRMITSGKNTTSLSSNEDDKEVANSFPNIDAFNKTTTAFPILQAPRLHPSNVRNLVEFNQSSSIFFLLAINNSC